MATDKPIFWVVSAQYPHASRYFLTTLHENPDIWVTLSSNENNAVAFASKDDAETVAAVRAKKCDGFWWSAQQRWNGLHYPDRIVNPGANAAKITT